MAKQPVGRIVWTDLTVPNAAEIRDFYAQVVGWKPQDVPVDDHIDFNMTDPASGDPVVGVCHALGDNKTLPPQWMIYITVDDLDASVKACEQLGGKVINPPRNGFCIIQDPAGAVCALFQA